ncbi:hypothetical protein [Mesobacillus stamsii]|uniref:Lipoprotein n=1 Tax=Mesobacillus stamsii TaxID=225347 RepID=A0ABU0FVA5_9BACI|nr:hypothetical protein [Mesobacillus stamsii]MDQ0413834.1 hypothetical protein [Mesobacillus stamsii]
MKKKLLMLIGGTLLSAMFLAGCATNGDQNPPPDRNVDNPADNNGNMNDNNGVNNNGVNDPNVPDTPDVNTNNDGDMMRDNNSPGEDAVEDKIDRNDKNNTDQ